MFENELREEDYILSWVIQGLIPFSTAVEFMMGEITFKEVCEILKARIDEQSN